MFLFVIIFLFLSGGQVEVQHPRQPVPGPGSLHSLQLLPLGVRRAGLRTGILHDQPQRAGVVGGEDVGLL